MSTLNPPSEVTAETTSTVRVVVYIDDEVEYDHSAVVPQHLAERVAYDAYVQVEDPNLDDED